MDIFSVYFQRQQEFHHWKSNFVPWHLIIIIVYKLMILKLFNHKNNIFSFRVAIVKPKLPKNNKWYPWNKNQPQILNEKSQYYGKSEICFSGFPKMVCQGTHILERYRWKILKLSQINGHILGFNPMIFSSLVYFVYPRSFSAAVCADWRTLSGYSGPVSPHGDKVCI